MTTPDRKGRKIDAEQPATPGPEARSVRSAVSSAYLHTALILLVGLIAYCNSFTVPMQFDDYRTLSIAYKNYSGGGINPFAPGASRWVVDVTFALERYLHGYWIYGYHIVNLAIHLGAALSLYGLAGLLLDACCGAGDPSRGPSLFRRTVPVATALLFVSHPIQTEAVTYISQRYTSLASLFYLAALFFYFKARRSMAPSAAPSRLPNGLFWWLGFTASALLAMKCKQISVTLPVMVAVFEGVCFRGYLYRKVPFLLLLAALLAVVPVQEISSAGGAAGSTLPQIVRQASLETEVIPRYSYFLTQQRVIVTYLRLLLLPVNQNLDYDYPILSSIRELPALASLLLNLSLFFLALYLLFRSRRKDHEGSDPALLLAGLGIVWFYLTLSVESSLIPISDVIFEHRLYLPSAGFFLAVTAGVVGAVARRPAPELLVRCTVAVVVTALTVATIARNNVWNSDLGMWKDVLEKSPDKARSRYVAGTLFLKRNMLDQAVFNFVRAIELNPARDLQRISLNHTIATMFPQFEKRSSTGGEYQLEFESVNPAAYLPWLAVSYNNLGLAYELLHDPDKARYYYSLAVIKNPALDLAWYNLALAAAGQGDREAYARAVERLKGLNPGLLHLLGP